MKFNLKSIGGKIFFLYMSLSLINISFFSIIIYENQIDLIIDNTILHSRELTDKISEQIQMLPLKRGYAGRTSINELTEGAAGIIAKHSSSFIIISTSGKIITSMGLPDIISEYDMANAVRAVTARSFTGESYLSDIDSSKNLISFYIPLPSDGRDENVLIFRKSLETINERMKELYREIGLVVLFLAIFHIAVAVLFFIILVKPLSKLHIQSRSLASGNYTVRSEIKTNDEIGELAEAFNIMAASIQEKVNSLEEYNRNMEYELALAGEVQKSIFPELSENKKFRFNVFSRPYGQVSGDYYDFFQLDDKSQAFLLADVSGHGVPAALMTMTLKEKFGLYAQLLRDPAEMFRLLNEKISAMFETGGFRPRYFSGFYMIIDSDNIMSYCNAGHPHPLVISENGTMTTLESEGGVVGMFSSMGTYYHTSKIQLKQGDRIVLITDGIIEAMNENDEQYGWERLINSLQDSSNLTISETVQRIISGLDRFTDIEKLHDDATIIGIEVL